jgi:hypothetical protein
VAFKFILCFVIFSLIALGQSARAGWSELSADIDTGDQFIELDQVAPVETVESQIRSVAVEFNKRFLNGKNIMTPAIRDAFIAKQSGLIAQWRRNGKLVRSIQVHNSFQSSLVFTVSAIQDGGRFLGAVVEKNRYDDKNDQASLWVYSIAQLKKGRSLFRNGNVDLITIRSDNLTPENGGEVYVKYPTNVKNNTFAETGISVLKSTTGNFSFFTLDRKGFSVINLHIWINIFDGPNYGVDKVEIK